MTELLAFAREVGDLEKFKFHYYRLAKNAWDQMKERPAQIKLKRYFYAPRPALCLEWLIQFEETPPMDLPSLCDGWIHDQKLKRDISDLVALKAVAKEADVVPPYPSLDAFIRSALKYELKFPVTSKNNDEAALKKADFLFQKFISA